MATRKTKQTPTSESHLTQRRFQNTAMPTNADETAPTSAPQPIAAEGATPITTLNIIPRSGLPPFPPFDPLSNRASLGLQWRKWRRRFENFAWVRPYDMLRSAEATRRVSRRGHKWHLRYFARLGTDYNTAIETRGGRGGDSAYERDGDARRKFWIKALKETDLGVAQAFFDP